MALLAPVLLPQAIWVASRAMRLPEAAGPRSGILGPAPGLRVLIVGDSSAAGVGVDHQTDALAGRLVHHLGAGHGLSWSLEAKSGWTSRQACHALEQLAPAAVDLAVIAVGVNDVKNGVHITKWRRNYATILDTLRRRHGATCCVASGVPPLGAFPLLPPPLRGVLGARASRFDAVLANLCRDTPTALQLPFDAPVDTAQMAQDGFHPGAPVYDIWAGKVVEAARGHAPHLFSPPCRQ
ncbi:SGNH/GDSL hydrolase family protein [uncultured Tateyamaria sp.]|uniref:SGNH/GDSL hydrolase family protein n=1 Tax=uncultured Tateyamaria sp. TaxID=455651 RepID=UPI0026071396|nr:SGNH/GDSL hydrolase family protein [uncultured Tateyamaria sp.]